MTKLEIKRPEVTYRLVTDASLLAEHERLNRELVAARANGGMNMMNGPIAPLERAISELEALMEAEVVTMTIRGLPRAQWTGLVEAHPPKEGNEVDAKQGVDMVPLMEEAIPLSVIALTQSGNPLDLPTEDEWKTLLDEMTDMQFAELCEKVYSANRGTVRVPFSLAVSRQTKSLDGN